MGKLIEGKSAGLCKEGGSPRSITLCVCLLPRQHQSPLSIWGLWLVAPAQCCGFQACVTTPSPCQCTLKTSMFVLTFLTNAWDCNCNVHLAQTLAHFQCPVCKLWEFHCTENRKKSYCPRCWLVADGTRCWPEIQGCFYLLFCGKKTLQQTKSPKPNAFAEVVYLIFVSHTWGCFHCSYKFGWLLMLTTGLSSSSSSCSPLAPEVPAQHGSKQNYGSRDWKTSFVCSAACFASGWLMQMFQWFRKRWYLVMETFCAGSEVQQFRCCCW